MAKKIEIPDEWYKKFQERAPDKGLDSAEAYVEYVLQQIYEKLQRQEGSSEDDGAYSEADEQRVKDRLKSLGYLD